MRKYIIIVVIPLLLASFSACKKWLDVKPEDKFLEEQIYSSVPGVTTALNGIYLDLSKSRLYGQNLTMSTVELFGQQYNTIYSGVTQYYAPYQTYTFTDSKVKASLESIWTGAYVAIFNANAFIAGIDKYKGVLPSSVDSIYRGEAYALRAMLHFDMLRLFGPVYATVDSTLQSIPYYDEVALSSKPLLPANEVMGKVLSDLGKAEKLLLADSIVSRGIRNVSIKDGKDYLRFRNYRMNYYAVKALQARAYLYRGNRTDALAAAKMVIEENKIKQWFPWTSPSVATNTSNPDRIFSSEMLFGLQCVDLDRTYVGLFAQELADVQLLAPGKVRLEAVFNTSSGGTAAAGISLDARFLSSWAKPVGAGARDFYLFFKYADVMDKTKLFRQTVPLFKLSELYYIAAEAETDPLLAKSYLEEIRNKRGLLPLATITSINTELLNEYRKDFYGEGQLFYYYKRTNATLIPNAAATSGNVSMTKVKYVPPLPDVELQYR